MGNYKSETGQVTIFCSNLHYTMDHLSECVLKWEYVAESVI